MTDYTFPSDEDQAKIMEAWEILHPGHYKAREVTADFRPQAIGVTLMLHDVEYKEGRKSKTWIKPKKEKLTWG